MENNSLTQSLECRLCKTAIDIESVFCSNCGFPEHGTNNEIASYHAKAAMDKNKHMDAGKKIKSARNTLYVMSAITLVFGLFYFFQLQDIAVLVTNIILCIIYLVLAEWTSKKPMMALLLGLLLYLTTIIISAIFEPSTIIKGILWKVIIISYLAKGIYSASSIKK